MLLQPNWTYRFKFLNDFSIFDGVYTVVCIFSFPEFLKEQVDLYKHLYKPCNLTEAKYDEDCIKYFKESIIKLQDPNDETNIVYSPESIITSYPVYNVQEYADVAIAFKLGIYPSASEFKNEINNISEQIATSLGVDPQTRIILTSKEYLTEDEYKIIQDERNQYKSSILNYFSENVRLNKEVLSLRTRIQKLESYIKKLAE